MDKKTANAILKIKNLDTVQAAAVEFIRLRNRKSKPEGQFDGRFFRIASHAQCGRCDSISEPTKAFPFSEMLHARSAVHVAQNRGASAAELRFIARLIDSDASLSQAGALQSAVAAQAIDDVLAEFSKKVAA